MKFCLKCGGLIGDNVNTCPICNYQFTEEDNKRIRTEKEENELKQQIYLDELLKKRARKRLIMAMLAIGFLIGSLILGGLVSSALQNVTYFGYIATAGMVLEIGTIIAGIVNGAFRCPHCDAVLFRNYGKFCMYCGKRLS